MVDQVFNLAAEKRRLMLSAQAGTPFTTIGFIYWVGLGIAGYYVTPRMWALLAFFTSGLMYPLALALSKLMHANVNAKSPLNGVMAAAFVAMLLTWPITITAFFSNPAMVPLSLAIGMSLHLPVIGWAYGTQIPIVHTLIRAGIVTALWFLAPDGRTTLLPLSVALIYLFSTVALRAQLKRQEAAERL